MNTKKSIVLTMVIATMFLIATIGSASAVTVITSCNFNANTPGEYYVLGNDLSCTAGQHGIIIGADNVIIDGYNETDNAYYTITGGGCTAAPITGIYNFDASHGDFGCGYNNTIVKNLEVKNFCIGIRTSGDYNLYSGQCLIHATNNTIDNCTVHDNGNPTYAGDSSLGIDLWPCASYNTIKNCEVYNTTGAVSTPPCESGGIAIRLKVASSHNTITDNTVHNNKGPAVLSKAWCTHNRITNNNFYENGEESYTGPTGGIVLRCYKTHSWTIDNNTITDNYGPGVWVGGGWTTIRDNVITGCKNRPSGDIKDGNGISICRCGEGGEGGMNSVIKDNTLCDNENKDISILVSGYNNTGDDNTCDSCANYNDEGETCCTYPCSVQVTFEKELVTGWNLVSLPLIPSDKTVSSVLNSIAGNYDAVVRYDVATHQFMELSADSEMNNGVGYFIRINETGTFTWNYSGTAYDSINVGLSQGLNCIGWTNTSTSLPDALNSIAGNYNYVAMWNTTLQSYEVYEPNAPAPFNDFAEMEGGVGYFIAAKGTCTLT